DRGRGGRELRACCADSGARHHRIEPCERSGVAMSCAARVCVLGLALAGCGSDPCAPHTVLVTFHADSNLSQAGELKIWLETADSQWEAGMTPVSAGQLLDGAQLGVDLKDEY